MRYMPAPPINLKPHVATDAVSQLCYKLGVHQLVPMISVRRKVLYNIPIAFGARIKLDRVNKMGLNESQATRISIQVSVCVMV
jgi:hypothetical protein